MLYHESTHLEESPYSSSAELLSVHDDGSQIITAGWTEYCGRYVETDSRRNQRTRFQFSSWLPELLTLEEAKERSKAFEARHAEDQ